MSPPAGRLSARDYETHILQTGQVPTRADTWHDVLNALVWLRFPRFKAALNAAHGAAMAEETDTLRGRRRDALTMLDESGVWVISRDPDLHTLLAEHAWQALFWERRHAVETAMQFVVVGHALLEKMLAPYPSITGKCLMLRSESLDPDAAEMQAARGARCNPLTAPACAATGAGHPGMGCRERIRQRITPIRRYSGPRVTHPAERLNPPPPAVRSPPATPAPSPGRRTAGYPPT